MVLFINLSIQDHPLLRYYSADTSSLQCQDTLLVKLMTSTTLFWLSLRSFWICVLSLTLSLMKVASILIEMQVLDAPRRTLLFRVSSLFSPGCVLMVIIHPVTSMKVSQNTMWKLIILLQSIFQSEVISKNLKVGLYQ